MQGPYLRVFKLADVLTLALFFLNFKYSFLVGTYSTILSFEATNYFHSISFHEIE